MTAASSWRNPAASPTAGGDDADAPSPAEVVFARVPDGSAPLAPADVTRWKNDLNNHADVSEAAAVKVPMTPRAALITVRRKAGATATVEDIVQATALGPECDVTPVGTAERQSSKPPVSTRPAMPPRAASGQRSAGRSPAA